MAATSDAPVAPSNAGQSYLGSMAAWAGSALGYAQDTINSFLGWEDLDVCDPEGETAEKGASKDEGLNQEERKKAWGTRQFQQYVGMDVTSLLSVPVWIMEPFTMLQKMAEIMEYTQLLDAADACEDTDERFAYVAAFLVSPFGASERAWKPFNPILGETFEVECGNGVHYLAEQVSHHPPVGAAHAESSRWSYDLVSAPTTKFLGNSLEIFPYGRTRLRLARTGELFTHTPPNAKANNIVIGRTWVDAAGVFRVRNVSSGATCLLDFTPCGWFGYGRYEFSGHVHDASGRKKLLLRGKWNSYCDLLRCDDEGEPLEDQEPRRLWTCTEKVPGDYYSFTQFAHRLNGTDGLTRAPLPSDSRRRPDRAALEEGDSGMAGSHKHRLEEMQRMERKHREAGGAPWEPRWFRSAPEAELLDGEWGADKVPFWEWIGDFEARRPAVVASTENVCGAGFNPWQFPEIHAEIL